MAYVLGIDAGGTFIDYFLTDGNGIHLGYKVLAKPELSDYGIIDGLQELSSQVNLDINDLIKKIKYIVHGTTVTTNAVLTRKGSKTALLTTEGLIDLLEMRQGVREDIYNNHIASPKPLVDRWLRIPIQERLDYQGNIITQLEETSAEARISKLRSMGIESIAIVLAHSYINPIHEYKLLEMVKKLLPNIHVSLSSLVYPKPHMYKRLSTTVLDAYIAPVLERYLLEFQQRLKNLGFVGQLLIMQANGGTFSVEESLHNPVMSILSGPAAGPASLEYIVKDHSQSDFIIMDMGGTSFDVSMVQNGYPAMRENANIAGHLLCLPTIDIHTLGSGGGSIAWVNNGKILHVGPDSAGANPGPACYDMGGDKATITDANLILGYINPEYFLEGRLKLNYKKAWQAIEGNIAKPLNLEVISAAIGIYKLINTDMAAGIKEITFEQGFDPRSMTLVVGGGAGPIHAAYLANQLGIKNIIIPKESSVMCAQGMLSSGYRRNLFQYYHKKLSNVAITEVEEIYNKLWENAGQEAINIKNLSIERTQVYMRYLGQHYDLPIDLDTDQVLNKTYLQNIFHQQHLLTYGYNLKDLDTEIELVGLAITVKGDKWITAIKDTAPTISNAFLKTSRLAYFEEISDFIEVAVYDGDKIQEGYKLLGPALIEQGHSTIVVPANFSLLYQANNFIMKKF